MLKSEYGQLIDCISAPYNLHESNKSTHMHHLNKVLDICMNKSDNMFFLRDFNFETSGNYLNGFCNISNLRSIVSELNGFKNLNNPSCIDSFITSHRSCFQNTVSIDNGIPDFHRM